MSNQVRSQLYTVYLRVADFVAADGDKTAEEMSGTASDGEFLGFESHSSLSKL